MIVTPTAIRRSGAKPACSAANGSPCSGPQTNTRWVNRPGGASASRSPSGRNAGLQATS